MQAGKDVAVALRSYIEGLDRPKLDLCTFHMPGFYRSFAARDEKAPAIIERLVTQARLGQFAPGLESFVKAHPDILRCKWEHQTLRVTPAPKTDLRTKMRKT